MMRQLAWMAAFLVIGAVAVTSGVAAEAEQKERAADEAYRLAVGLHNIPLHKEAAAKLKAFLETCPDDRRCDAVLYRLGDCRVHLEQHEEALAAFQRVVEDHPESLHFAESLYRVGELNQFLGRHEKSVDAYARFLKRFRKHELAPAVKEKEQAVRIALLYRQVEADPDGALKTAAALATRDDAVAEEALFVRGSLLFNAEDYEAAAPVLKSLIKRYPKSGHCDEAHLNLANALIGLDQLDESLVHLATVQTTRLDEVRYLRGTVLQQQGVTNKAAVAFREVADKHKDSRYRPYSLFELGRLGDAEAWDTLRTAYPDGELADEVRYRQAVDLANSGDTAAALKRLDAIDGDSARRTDADLLASELRSASDLPKALALLAALEKKDDVSAERLSRARYAVALAALDQGKAAEALRQLDAILQDPKSESLHADCLYRRGLAYEALKKQDDALQAFDALIDRYPGDTLVPYALVRVSVLTREKNDRDELDPLRRIVKDFPDFEHLAEAKAMIDDAIYRQAWEHYDADEFLQAAALFDRLKEHKTYGAEAAYLAGVSFDKEEKPTEAERCLAFLLDQQPDYEFAGDARELLGELLSSQKKWQDAARHYGSYASGLTNPVGRAAAELKQGMALFQLNQAARAKTALEYASTHGEPAVKARALFFLGELLLMQKKHAEAKDYFLKVGVLYRHEELTPASLVEAAKCLRAIGDPKQSRAIIARLLKEFPDSPHAREGKKMLAELTAE